MADLLPTNATALQRAICDAAARILDVDADVVRRASLADDCPEALLPWLAWARSVDEWDAGWPVAVRRAVVRESFAYHGRKGEPTGVRAALAQLGVDATMAEWFETGRLPYTFGVNLALAENQPYPDSGWAQLLRLVNSAKNARSLLDLITAEVRFRAPAPRVAAWLYGEPAEVTIYPQGTYP
jgi:phage tail P2-like protein